MSGVVNPKTTQVRRRPKIDHEERRNLVLRVAAQVFVERGLRGATMDDVAQACGLSKVLVYRQFESKDALVAAIFDEVIAALTLLKAEPWSGYSAGTVGTLAEARKRPDAFLLLYRDCRGDPQFQHHFDRLQLLYVDWLMGFFESERGKRTRRAIYAEMAVRNLTGLLFEALINWLEMGEAAEDELLAAWIGDTIRSWRWNTEQRFLIPRRRQ